MALRLLHCVGAEVAPYLADLARLRIAVFRDWPYLYDGETAYENEYLRAYARSPRSIFVLALDRDAVVGAATGIPLLDDAEAFRVPFLQRGIDPATVFYCGESVLLPAYRGQGIGHRFFDGREAHARALGGFTTTAFCAVERAPEDPRRPAGARSNEVFWRKRGYLPQPDMFCRLSWKQVGDASASEQSLRFWLRRLENTPV